MITFSWNIDKDKKRGEHEQEIRDLVDTHLTFPGSDKLKLGVNIKNDGAASISFTGPKEALAEAKRLWHENVKPAAEKVKRAAAKLKRDAARASKKVKRKVAAKKAVVTKKVAKKKAAPKKLATKKAVKKVVARAKAKVTRKS